MTPRADGWDIAGAIEHHPEVKKVRAMVDAVRTELPDIRDFEGLVAKEVTARHGEKILAGGDTVLALVSFAILHLCEQADMEALAP
jgi:hypothetical protein